MSERVRVGLIGAGGIAQKRHIPALTKHPDVDLVAICETRTEVLNKVAADAEIAHKFTDYHELVNMDDLDVIVVCTPNFLHEDPAVAALEAGKHVFVEKPIALNADQGQRMVDAAQKAGKKLMVGYCWRWNPDAAALKSFIKSGEMGDIYYARVQALRRRGIPSWGVFTQKEKQGGGPLIDIGCHIIDLTLWLMGHPKPVAVSGKCYTKFGNRSDIVGLLGQWDPKKYTVEDFATALVRFENGATLSIESSFAANIEKDVFNTALMGTEGGCELNPLKIYMERNMTLLDVTPVGLPKVMWHEAEIFEFIKAIQEDAPVPVTGEEGLMVAKIIDGIYRSSECGREVLLD